jgi:hypothetical protein
LREIAAEEGDAAAVGGSVVERHHQLQVQKVRVREQRRVLLLLRSCCFPMPAGSDHAHSLLLLASNSCKAPSMRKQWSWQACGGSWQASTRRCSSCQASGWCC